MYKKFRKKVLVSIVSISEDGTELELYIPNWDKVHTFKIPIRDFPGNLSLLSLPQRVLAIINSKATEPEELEIEFCNYN